MNWKLIMLPVAAIAALLASPGVGTAQTRHKKVYTIADESARTLKDIEEQAYEVTDHTGTVQVASGFPTTTRDLFETELEAVKQDVNRMGKELGRLEALRQDEKSWERRTVARIRPLLKQVAASTDEAIGYVNNNPEKLALPEYQQITKRLYGESTKLWQALHESVRLESLHEKELRLRKQLKTANK